MSQQPTNDTYKKQQARLVRATFKKAFISAVHANAKTVDVSYGGEAGFNQAIELSAETLGSVKLIQEKKLIQKWFDEIAMDTGIAPPPSSPTAIQSQ